MTGDDDEFDDFLARRRRIFRLPERDVLEPPADVDRIVLRQAREAIESRHTDREIRGMSWGAPLALAASLLVAFTIVLNVGATRREPVPEVTIESVAQRREAPPPAPAAADFAPASPAAAVPGLVTPEEAARHAPPPPPAPAASPARSAAVTDTVAKADPAPAYRRDSTVWLAEIQRLRAAGREAEADAELAEYQRQHRAYAVSPDR